MNLPPGLEPLRYPHFRTLLAARLAYNIGGYMFGLTVMWLVNELTHDPYYAGLVGLVEVIPVLILAFVAGHYTDKYDRRTIVLISRAAMLVTSVAFLLAPTKPSLYILYGLLMARAAARTFFSASQSNLVQRTVPAELLPQCVPLTSSIWYSGAIIGPVIAGAVIATTKTSTVAFGIEIALALVALGLYVTLPKQQPEPMEQEDTWSSIRAGYDFLRANPIVFSAIALDLFAVLLGGAVILLPRFNEVILRNSPTELGWLTAATPIGALICSQFLTHRPPMKRAGMSMLLAVAGFGLATIGFGLSKTFWLAFLMICLTGAFDGVSVIIRSTLLFTHVPDNMRGRVGAFNDVFVSSSNELGGFESGFLARWVGLVPAIVIGGIGTIASVLGVAALSPKFRDLGEMKAASE